MTGAVGDAQAGVHSRWVDRDEERAAEWLLCRAAYVDEAERRDARMSVTCHFGYQGGSEFDVFSLTLKLTKSVLTSAFYVWLNVKGASSLTHPNG
jgi:hypothetical protein